MGLQDHVTWLLAENVCTPLIYNDTLSPRHRSANWSVATSLPADISIHVYSLHPCKFTDH